MKTGAASLAVILALALALAAHTASASHQAAGCRSTAPQTGALVSPTLDLEVISGPQLRFNTWWEIESVAPNTRDLLKVEYSTDNGATWQATKPADLNPAQPDQGASPSSPHSNRGLAVRPSFQAASPVHTLAGAAGQRDVRVRFVFDSVDQDRNGFRGWAIDDVRVTDQIESGLGTPPTTFEPGNGADWTFTGSWHVVSENAGVAMSPQIVPALVTLGANDDGTLPPDPEAGHTQYAWFGYDATGTYCDAAALAEPQPPNPTPSEVNSAPSAAFTVNPVTPHTSDAVSFDGTPSADPEGVLASYTWDFGDGTSASGPTASHVYVKAGTYNVTLTVADAQGATSTATHALQVGSNLGDRIVVADKLDDLPNPKPFEEVNVEPTEGQVFVQIDGRVSAAQTTGAPRGFIPLTQAAQLPIGSVLETSRGKVLVESSRDRRARRTQRAEFFDGRFSMRQPRVRRGPLTTEMVLKGGSFRGCPRARQSASWSRANDAQRRRRSRVRRLWGNGRGRFRTRGRYSSATVRGTTWLVEDRCDGTLTRLPRRPRTSVVDVRDLVTRRTVRLRAGRSYLARPRASGRR